MKNLLPYLGALALGASIIIATNDKATAQTPQTTSPPAEISELHLIHGWGPNSQGLVIRKDQGFSIQLRANEFIFSQGGPDGKFLGVRHIPMSAVGYYKVAGEE